MGIPSYYSYIIRNHNNIIKKFGTNSKYQNLYLDSNSIIYDTVRSIEYNNNITLFENNLIKAVCAKLFEYINMFNNPDIVFIAFDGVAPLAKLEQQRNRRYKSQFTSDVLSTISVSNEQKWNTTAITPGTAFMEKLDKKVALFFKKYKNVIVSGSNIPGEGEHKIFTHLRSNNNINSNTAIYGLDADLIMLGLNHLSYCKHIFLYRETPHYIGNLNSDLDKDQNYLLDLSELSKGIIFNMTSDTNYQLYNYKIYDYIFLGLMLGNDFMPHFPALNIRTFGVDVLLETYYHFISKNECIFNGKQINWKLFRKLINELAKNELDYLLEEYKQRNNMSKRTLPNKTPEEKERKFQAIPIYQRQVENFINPGQPYWEHRYYKMLFHIDINEDKLKNICRNYLEGLEWNCIYYTSGCPDWNWSYKYDYPPLLSDLLKHVPYFQTKFIENKPEEPVKDLVQLAYVLPIKQLHLLPKNVYEKLKDKHWYSDNFNFKWSFCKYFWESHVEFPTIDLDELKIIVS